MAQHGALEGMEVCLVPNRSECERGQVVTIRSRVERSEKPMIDFSDGSTADGGRVVYSVGNVVLTFTNSIVV